MGEYLRRGIEEIRRAAAYIHFNNAEALERYPSLFFVNRRKKANGKTRKDNEPHLPAIDPPSATVDPLPATPMAVPIEAAAVRSVS